MRKYKIKHNFPSTIEKILSWETSHVGEDVEKQVHSYTTGQNIN